MYNFKHFTLFGSTVQTKNVFVAQIVKLNLTAKGEKKNSLI